MTLVIRITLSFVAAVTVISLTSDADAQIFRRLRDNIRTTYPPQGPVAPQQQLRPQIQPQRPGPVVNQPQGQTGRTLTPYSRLTPEQRSATTNTQAVRTANPNVNSEQVNVRVVTYYDPRTGRTFQRRFVLPPNNDGPGQVNNGQPNRQIAGGSSPITRPAEPKKLVYDRIPRPAVTNPPQQQQLRARPSITVAPQLQSVISSINVNQAQTQIQQTPVTQQLPFLAGPPSIMSATPTATSPIYTQPMIQAPTPQVAPTPSVGIVIEPVANGQDVASKIVIDTAVAPATAVSEANDTAISISSANSDDGAPAAFSVLEMSDSDDGASAESTDFDIEIGSADEVQAFFGE